MSTDNSNISGKHKISKKKSKITQHDNINSNIDLILLENIDDIINNIHDEIITDPSEVRPSPRRQSEKINRVETMSVSDEEITSIIEDTADLNGILMNNNRTRGRPSKKSGSARTLNL